jgi:hypothetical protein
MNNFSKALFFGFFVVIGLDQSTLSQSKEFSYGEVGQMEQTALGLIRAIPHRSTATHESFPGRGKEPTWKSVLTSETIAPDRSRWIQQNLVSESSGSFKRMEVVSISGKHYQKIDNGPWLLKEPPPPPVVPTVAADPRFSKPRFENHAWLIETLTEKGRLVTVYETKSRSTREQDGKEISQITTSRYWFRDDGMLLKRIREFETVGDPKILKNSTVYEYEDIKIEAPIM